MFFSSFDYSFGCVLTLRSARVHQGNFEANQQSEEGRGVGAPKKTDSETGVTKKAMSSSKTDM